MTKEAKNAEAVTTKRFSVVENGSEVLNTTKQDEAMKKIIALQKEHKPLIVLLDGKERKSIRYRKEKHQKNYRVEPGDYEKDSVLSPVAATPETEA